MTKPANAIQDNKMCHMPLGKLLVNMATPMVIAMLVQAFYNVVDSFYVAKISENAVTALGLAFPVQNIQIGFATGIGVGVNALLSKSLGEGNRETANRAAGNGIVLVGIVTLLFIVFGIFGAQPFFEIQSSDAETVRGGVEYMTICCVFSLGIFVEVLGERLLQASGRTVYTLITQGSGAVLNIILDPLFIFGVDWLGIPAMGFAGAAIATVIGQACAAGLGMFLHLRKNKELRIHMRDLIPEWHLIRDVYKIGVPSILMMCISSFTNFSMNRILIGFTPTAVAVYGSYFKIQSFIFMPVFGLNSAIIPIVGYNYGAAKPQRVYRTIRFGVMYAMSLMCFGLLMFQLIPGTLLQLFAPSAEMLAIGVPALRIISIHFPIAAFCVVAVSVCQALDKSIFSMFCSLLRQLVVLVPSAYFLSLSGNVDRVWWCFPIAEIMAALAGAFFLRQAIKGMKQNLAQRGVL